MALTAKSAASSLKARLIRGKRGALAIYHGEGRGDRLLFLHSDAGLSGQWQEVIDLLSRDFEICALDFRGHGASAPADNDDYSFAGRAEDVLAAADALNWDQFVLVAHSGGAAVGLEVGARAPSRVRALVMVDPASDPGVIPKEQLAGMIAALSGPDGLQHLKQYYLSISGPDKTVQERVLKDVEATAPNARAGVAKELADWDANAAIDSYGGPKAILGTEITDGPGSLHALRPAIPYELTKGTGHWLQIERPEIVAEAVRQMSRRDR
jgi:pimeloyl-ACP methyl ester carboxylesterase